MKRSDESADPADREVARRLGERLDEQAAEGRPDSVDAVSLLDSDVAGAIRAMRTPRPEGRVTGEERARMWMSVRSAMQEATEPSTSSRPRSKAWSGFWAWLSRPIPAFALASAVVVGAALVWTLWPSGPMRVASADSTTLVFAADDGSTVTLRPYSSLYRLGPSERSFRLVGEGFFDVVRDVDRSFVVETVEGRVEVLGTRFNLASRAGRTEVFLEEGSVQLSLPDGSAAVVLDPGEQSAISNGMIQSPERASADEHVDWLRDELTFERRILREVVAELEHHFSVTVDVPDFMATETISGSVALTDVASTLEALAFVLGGRFIETPTGYRFESGQ